MDMSRHYHAYEISWKDIPRNLPARYLPPMQSYILVPLAPYFSKADSTLAHNLQQHIY